MANDIPGHSVGSGMHVEFTFHGTVREAAGRDRLERDMDLPADATVGDAPDAVLRAHVALRRNGEDVSSGDGLETGIDDGDRIDLEPSVKGAC